MLPNLLTMLALARWESPHHHFRDLRVMLNISYGCVAVRQLLMVQLLIKR
jgi:hypothetical protein